MFKTKVLSKTDFDQLSNRANNYDKIVALIIEDNPNLKAEDVSFETIQEMMGKESSSQIKSDFQSKIDALQSQYENVVKENTALQTQVNNLLNTAGEDGATISSKSEPTANPLSLAEKLKQNSGNYPALKEIMENDKLI